MSIQGKQFCAKPLIQWLLWRAKLYLTQMYLLRQTIQLQNAHRHLLRTNLRPVGVKRHYGYTQEEETVEKQKAEKGKRQR